MKVVIRHAVVSLVDDSGTALVFADQTVAIYKNTVQAIIGIDGHSSFWDDLVEVSWEGSHLGRLERVNLVEIRDGDGNVVECLPVNRTRDPQEKDGDTVFFLTEEE